MANGGSLSRRSFCAGVAGTFACTSGIVRAQSSDTTAIGTPVLTPPKIVGPIPVTATSKPYMTSTKPGSFAAQLLQKYDYVEEEYFLSGYANVYGPGALRPGLGVERDLGALRQGSEPLGVDHALVHEQVARAILGGDEAEPLLVAEPLDCASRHLILHRFVPRPRRLKATNDERQH